ncbi:DNA gyrase inhibitor YacG [Parvularcula sp. ZS-1/3]|uniref:DNA gyrase inhibitor YacG n=1 Tax=Parvularcula mediterranea TaxID=2732508 RepID=A0A7Y3RMB9_9PROT|nr:DNA gyrase inhibitor YacG [Parvularcula mediterranea]NNU16630.1 DNA gyrase inhibitor YacG [Parvularcula mediterranea]
MRCPICEKQTDKSYEPFCSKRCADVDLGRWLNESYKVGGAEDESAGSTDEDEGLRH